MATILKPQDQQNSNVPQAGAPTPNTPQVQNQLPNQRRQGSGQFTNIQSYLNANKGAGQRLAQGVASQVQKTLDPAKQQAQQYNEQVRQGIQSAQNTLQQGQGQLGQLRQIGSNIQGNTGQQFYGQDKDLGIDAFRNDPNFNQFQRIQQGQGVNEDQLNLQQQAFANQANQYNRLAEEKAALAGDEAGRFDLLKRSFGGNVNPKYTSGQQRLDQLFLARQGLGGLRQDLQQNINQSKGLQAQTQETGKGTRLAQEQERSLIGDIDTTTKENEANYLKMLESYVPEINKRREQEFSDLEKRYAGMSNKNLQAGGLLNKQVVGKDGKPALQKATPTQEIQRLSADDLKKLGLTKNSQLFDVFDKTKLQDVAEKGRMAQGFADVANERNVDAYNKLAEIARIDQGNRKITQAANLGDAVLARQGEANLQARLNSAANKFYNEIAKKQQGRANQTANTLNQHIQSDNQKQWSTLFDDPRNEAGGVTLANILSGKDMMGAHRGYGSDVIDKQAQRTYNEALKQLRNSGALNVLTTGGDIASGADKVRANINKKQYGLGELRDSSGSLARFNSTIDEDTNRFLQQYGIKPRK